MEDGRKPAAGVSIGEREQDCGGSAGRVGL
jgi:hypothetical protein